MALNLLKADVDGPRGFWDSLKGPAGRADVQIVNADGTRDTKPTSIFRSKSCLPMAQGLAIGGAETSVRRRY
jgi:hypothetical protein